MSHDLRRLAINDRRMLQPGMTAHKSRRRFACPRLAQSGHSPPRSKWSLSAAGFNRSAQHLLTPRGEEVDHGDVTGLGQPRFSGGPGPWEGAINRGHRARDGLLQNDSSPARYCFSSPMLAALRRASKRLCKKPTPAQRVAIRSRGNENPRSPTLLHFGLHQSSGQ